jgi:outer membrane lipoprotein-sorting protein
MKKSHLAASFTAAVSIGLSGCGAGDPEWVAVYEDCNAKMEQASAQMQSEIEASGGKNAEAQAMAEAMGNMVISMGKAACGSIKEVCEKDPDGQDCQSIVQEYKKDMEE